MVEAGPPRPLRLWAGLSASTRRGGEAEGSREALILGVGGDVATKSVHYAIAALAEATAVAYALDDAGA